MMILTVYLSKDPFISLPHANFLNPMKNRLAFSKRYTSTYDIKPLSVLLQWNVQIIGWKTKIVTKRITEWSLWMNYCFVVEEEAMMPEVSRNNRVGDFWSIRSRHHFNTSEEFIFDLGEETKIRGSLSIFASFHFNTQ